MTRASAFAVFVALGLLTWLPRTIGIDYLLPHQPEPDAQIVLQAREFRTGQMELEFIRSTYPHLLARLLSLFPSAACEHPLEPAFLHCHLRAAAAPFLQARHLCALLSALAVPLTYFLARRWLGVYGALLASALLATSLLHVSLSQQARPHGPFATAVALCLLTALQLREDGRVRSYIAFGLALGVAIGTLHTAAFVVLLGPAALLLRNRSSERPTALRIAIPIALSAAAALAFWPFLYEPSPEGEWREGESYRFPHRVERNWFDAGGFAKNAQFLWDYDPLIAALVLVALVAVLVQRRNILRNPNTLLAMVFALPYVTLIGAFQKTFPRFLLPLLPCLVIAAAYPLDLWVSRLRGRAGWWVGALGAVAVLGFPAYVSGRLLWLHSQPDTLENIATQIWQLPEVERLVIAAQTTVTLPIFVHQDLIARVQNRITLQHAPWLVYVDRCTPDNFRAPGPRLQTLQIDGRFPSYLLRNPEGVKTLQSWLAEQRADLYLTETPPSPELMANFAQAMAPLSAHSEWHPTPTPWELASVSDDYQDDKLLRRVLGRNVWGPVVGVFYSHRYAARDLPPLRLPAR